MKRLKSITGLFICFYAIVSCTQSSNEINSLEQDDLLLKSFVQIDAKIKTASREQFNMDRLSEELDHSGNYEQIIYDAILNNAEIESNTSQVGVVYDYFDEVFAQYLVMNFIKDDIMTFFDRTELYISFIDENIADLEKREHLIDAIEQYKWIKYGLVDKLIKIETQKGQDMRCGVCQPETACFDSCMEGGIEEQLDSVWGWAEFLWNPGGTTLSIFGGCIESCYF